MKEYGGTGELGEGELRDIMIKRMGVGKGMCDVQTSVGLREIIGSIVILVVSE